MPWEEPPEPEDEIRWDEPPEEDTWVEPAAWSVPAPPPSAGAPAGDTAAWRALLPQLEGALPIGIYNLLGDEYAVRGRVEGDDLVLSIQPGFLMSMINTPDNLSAIQKKSGRRVRVEELREPERDGGEQNEKLNQLGKFKNVTIK